MVLLALTHQLYVPTLLYVRFISAADKAGGGVRKRVRKRDMYVCFTFKEKKSLRYGKP